MEHKKGLFRRGLAILLCLAMLASYAVLPVSAEDTAISDGA